MSFITSTSDLLSASVYLHIYFLILFQWFPSVCVTTSIAFFNKYIFLWLYNHFCTSNPFLFSEILKVSLPKVPGKQLGIKLVSKKWVQATNWLSYKTYLAKLFSKSKDVCVCISLTLTWHWLMMSIFNSLRLVKIDIFRRQLQIQFLEWECLNFRL